MDIDGFQFEMIISTLDFVGHMSKFTAGYLKGISREPHGITHRLGVRPTGVFLWNTGLSINGGHQQLHDLFHGQSMKIQSIKFHHFIVP